MYVKTFRNKHAKNQQTCCLLQCRQIIWTPIINIFTSVGNKKFQGKRNNRFYCCKILQKPRSIFSRKMQFVGVSFCQQFVFPFISRSECSFRIIYRNFLFFQVRYVSFFQYFFRCSLHPIFSQACFCNYRTSYTDVVPKQSLILEATEKLYGLN